jgi:protein associated with RNAse G/E
MEDTNLINTWIEVQSYKHNGDLHRAWQRNFVLENNDDWLIVASRVTPVIEGNGRVWYTREPAVTFFSKKMWFNAIGMIKPGGIAFYVNIASPTLIDGNVAKYIDYDLDFKMSETDKLSSLDHNEFLKHIKSYEYGEELVKIISDQAKKTKLLMEQKDFPFDINEVSNYYLKFLELTDKKQH